MSGISVNAALGSLGLQEDVRNAKRGVFSKEKTSLKTKTEILSHIKTERD